MKISEIYRLSNGRFRYGMANLFCRVKFKDSTPLVKGEMITTINKVVKTLSYSISM
jgi:hypothetical protein